MHTVTRHPAVAGRFYPKDPQKLRSAVESFLPHGEKVGAFGCVVPHAGYVYSGQVAGAVFARIEVPKRCIVLCPNHTGLGQALAIMSRGTWETPLGTVSVDTELAEALKERFSPLAEDAEAHQGEHAVEVELPFLQTILPDVTFVPIALGTRRFEILQALGKAMAAVIAGRSGPVLIVASSDMNHYENDAVTRIKDHKAIDRILALDARGLFEVVAAENISMCGFGPVVAMLTAAAQLGARQAELVKYCTSGDVSGDQEMVVGYAGVVVS
jgi:AmmeMemoRadiSam system protein B